MTEPSEQEKRGPTREWLKKMADIEDRCASVSVNLLVFMFCFSFLSVIFFFISHSRLSYHSR